MKLDRLRIRSLECSRRNHRRRLKSLESRLDAAGEEFKTASALIGAIRPLVEAITRDFEVHGKRLAALESSEVELREHCQGNVPMSVFNGLRWRVDSLSSDMSSLENQVARELRALVPKGEDDAYKAWRREPWPDDVVTGGHGVQLEEAFRAGFRAGRK